MSREDVQDAAYLSSANTFNLHASIWLNEWHPHMITHDYTEHIPTRQDHPAWL